MDILRIIENYKETKNIPKNVIRQMFPDWVKFYDGQQKQIILGFKNNLPLGKILHYARKDISVGKMQIYRDAFQCGFSIEQADKLVSLKFDDYQMLEIKEGLKRGFSPEQIMFYARPELTARQMEEIKYAFIQGLTVEHVQEFADVSFDLSKMREIRTQKALEVALRITGFKESDFTSSQLETIRYFLSGHYSKYFNKIENIELLINPELSEEQMKAIFYAISCNLPKEKIKLFAKPEFHAEHMVYIAECMTRKIPENQIKLLLNPNLSVEQIKEILTPFLERGQKLTTECLEVCTKYRFSEKQVKEIKKGFKDGLSKKQVLIYAKPEFDEKQMEQIRKGLKKKLPLEYVLFYANKNYTAEQMQEIRYAFLNGFSLEDVKRNFFDKDGKFKPIDFVREMRINTLMNELFSQIRYSPGNFNEDQIQWLKAGFLVGLNVKQVSIYAKPYFNDEEENRALIIKLLKDGKDEDAIKIYIEKAGEFDYSQKYKLLDGIRMGLTGEEIRICANPLFSAWQMEQIIEGFENGLSVDQVKIYARPEFDSSQMEEIKKGFLNGLTMEQTSVYAEPEINWQEMKKIRKFLLEHKRKSVNKLYKEIKNKIENTEEEELFITAYELKIKKDMCKEIIRSVEQKLPNKPKVKMRL